MRTPTNANDPQLLRLAGLLLDASVAFYEDHWSASADEDEATVPSTVHIVKLAEQDAIGYPLPHFLVNELFRSKAGKTMLGKLISEMLSPIAPDAARPDAVLVSSEAHVATAEEAGARNLRDLRGDDVKHQPGASETLIVVIETACGSRLLMQKVRQGKRVGDRFDSGADAMVSGVLSGVDRPAQGDMH